MVHARYDRLANPDDVRRVLGDVADHIVIEVLASNPSLGELTRAALWERGDGDHEARLSHALSAREGAIVIILVRLREEALKEPNK